MSYCAIDFGTSNSAVALPRADGAGMLLAPVEGQQQTLPTAIFFNHDEGVRNTAAPRSRRISTASTGA